MRILFTFPGQGAQRPAMLHSLPDHPEVKRTLEETAEYLSRDPMELDTPDALRSTIAVQLCLLIAGVAMARTLMACDALPDMVAGLSIGAYPAAVIAGALDYRDAIGLVAQRGKLMEDAYPEGYGMAAIAGLNRYQLEILIKHVHSDSTPVFLANLNAPFQFVIAGSIEAIQLVMQRALKNGAVKAERLSISVPSHCALLDEAASQMLHAFEAVKMQRPKITFLSSSFARALYAPARIADDLAFNMARQVHWSDTVELAWEMGSRLAVEMPTGNVLTNLTASLFKEGITIASDKNRIDTLLTLVLRERNVKQY
jgi:malonate decarboxylase epsilon subunit